MPKASLLFGWAADLPPQVKSRKHRMESRSRQDSTPQQKPWDALTNFSPSLGLHCDGLSAVGVIRSCGLFLLLN